METWKPIKGYEGFYEVSSLGRIKSLSRKEKRKNGTTYTVKESIISQSADKKGYFRTRLRKLGEHHTFLTHRLVAMAFVENPNRYAEVNHKDENKGNNRADNLEWCNRKYNINYGTGRAKQAASLSKKVYQYTANGTFIKEWPSTKECGRAGHCQWRIVDCCRGKAKTHHGYKWSYEPL
jgi:hypothetical protein